MTGWSLPIDYERLELELEEAIRADQLYRLQNEAKLRAVEQNVPTYERFRQMVNGAHLRPLERKDVESKPDIPWNPVTSSNSHQEAVPYRKENGDSSKVSTDFQRAWNDIDDDKRKFAYLHSARHQLRTDLCRVEVPPSLLSEILRICLAVITDDDPVKPVLEILETFTACPRFPLTVSFMSEDERDICTRLFRGLILAAENPLAENPLADEIQSLASAYQAKLD